MQQVQGGKFARLLQGLFSTQGKLSLLLDTVVIPTVQLADLSGEARGNPASGVLNVPAGGAGFRSELQINIPGGEGSGGVEMLITRMLLHNNAGAASQKVYFGESPGFTPNLTGTKQWRDSGLQGNPQAIIQGKNNAAAASGFTINGVVWVPPESTVIVELNWSLVVGDTAGLMVRAAADNLGLECGFFWRELAPR